jgi:hypothetical protein
VKRKVKPCTFTCWGLVRDGEIAKTGWNGRPVAYHTRQAARASVATDVGYKVVRLKVTAKDVKS